MSECKECKVVWEDLPTEIWFEIVKMLIPTQEQLASSHNPFAHAFRDVVALGGTSMLLQSIVLIPGTWTRLASVLASVYPRALSGPLLDDGGTNSFCTPCLWNREDSYPLETALTDLDWVDEPPASLWEGMERMASVWTAWVGYFVDDLRTGAEDAQIEWPYRNWNEKSKLPSIWDTFEEDDMGKLSAFGHLYTACVCSRTIDFGVRIYLPKMLQKFGILVSVNHQLASGRLVFFGVLIREGIDPLCDRRVADILNRRPEKEWEEHQVLGHHPDSPDWDQFDDNRELGLGSINVRDDGRGGSTLCAACGEQCVAFYSDSGPDAGDGACLLCPNRHFALSFTHWCL